MFVKAVGYSWGQCGQLQSIAGVTNVCKERAVRNNASDCCYSLLLICREFVINLMCTVLHGFLVLANTEQLLHPWWRRNRFTQYNVKLLLLSNLLIN